ncbi:Histone-lysine N-methyltransferase SETDB1-B [Fasciolopsis buskii]|uniref:Histone-lysine N-methyltransferase SETDB1-B n=1 Tax=Fasciolopsis buskii TaxID=27845 RepID=A0A8E0RMW4_9TREM|nr:Histone-lysine N-methyltransferase SETDB1-B [Fasciolopsis buski]
MFLFGKALADQSSLADLRSARKSATGNRDPKTLPHSTAQSKSGLDTRAATRRHTGSVNLAELESAGKVVSYLDHLFDKIETKPFAAVFLSYLLVGHPRENERRMIVYRAPCGRHLRSLHEVQRFLDRSNSQLTTDLFCFDPELIINSEFHAEKTLTNIADISYGKENIPVPCVNSVDNEVPGYIEYIPKRQPIDKVPLLQDDNFIVCCECTDNCRDRRRCACQQLTAQAAWSIHRRVIVTDVSDSSLLEESTNAIPSAVVTVVAITELYRTAYGPEYSCSKQAARSLRWYEAIRMGWGIRALHAIPKGTFLCTYAGAIYDENTAVQQGFDYGDEYQAELDYIETVEKPKDGYESMPEDPEENSSSEQIKSDSKLIKSRSTPSFSDMCEKAGRQLASLSRPSSTNSLSELGAVGQIDVYSDLSSISGSTLHDNGDTNRTRTKVMDTNQQKDDSERSKSIVDLKDSPSKSNLDSSVTLNSFQVTRGTNAVTQTSLEDKKIDVEINHSLNLQPVVDSPEIRRAGDHLANETLPGEVEQTVLNEHIVMNESTSDVQDSSASPGSSISNMVEQTSIGCEPSTMEDATQSVHSPDSAKSDPDQNIADTKRSNFSLSQKPARRSTEGVTKQVSLSENLRVERSELRPRRTCVKARSSSVPAEFWSLQNARSLLPMLDFDRIPFVRLSPIKSFDYLPEPESQPVGEPSEHSHDDRLVSTSSPGLIGEDPKHESVILIVFKILLHLFTLNCGTPFVDDFVNKVDPLV